VMGIEGCSCGAQCRRNGSFYAPMPPPSLASHGSYSAAQSTGKPLRLYVVILDADPDRDRIALPFWRVTYGLGNLRATTTPAWAAVLMPTLQYPALKSYDMFQHCSALLAVLEIRQRQ
jgi:hypothetical protein